MTTVDPFVARRRSPAVHRLVVALAWDAVILTTLTVVWETGQRIRDRRILKKSMG